MATRKVRINTGSANPLEIPEQAGKLHVKTSGGVVPLTELWAKDSVDSTAELIWKVVPVDVPTQIDTQDTVDPGPCSGAVCASGTYVEYPVIPGADGARWDCSQWDKTGNCVRGSLVTDGTFSWSWHGGPAEPVADIYEVTGTYSPPPPGHIVLDYGTEDVSSQIIVFLKSHLAGVIDGAANLLPIIMTTGARIYADCAGSMPIFPGGSDPVTAGYTFSSSHGASSTIPYVYICGYGTIAQGAGYHGCRQNQCYNAQYGTGGLINPNESICECSSATAQCIQTCCSAPPEPPGNPDLCGRLYVQDCLATTGQCSAAGTPSSNNVIDLIGGGRVIPLINTECIRTDTECSTICYSVPTVQTPVLFGSVGTPPLLQCRSVCRVPNVVFTATQFGYDESAPIEGITPKNIYNSGHKFSDFGMVMRGGCNCADCPQSTCAAAVTQRCPSRWSMRIILPFYFNFPNTMFNNFDNSNSDGLDLRGRIIDITFPGMFRAYPSTESTVPPAGVISYPPGNTTRTLPVILSGIRDLLVGRISSCCSVMAPVYFHLPEPNATLILNDGDPNICWCMNEFPCQNGNTPSHTHQLVIELNLGVDEICPQCLFSTPTGPDYAYNIDAFQFYPITDRTGTILEPLGSFLSKQLTGDSGVSGIKSLRWMSHETEGSNQYGNIYSNKETTFNYTNRAEIGSAWEGVYLDVPDPPGGPNVISKIVTNHLNELFSDNVLSGNNSNILNKLLNVIQQPQYLIDAATDCECEAVP